MSSLIILGAGGHGKVVGEAAAAMGRWKKIAFLDNQFPELDSVLGWRVLGPWEEAPDYRDRGHDICLAMGDNALRYKWLGILQDMGIEPVSIIHPAAWISPSAEIVPGCAVFAGAVVNAAARAGAGTILNTGATVDHDCVLAESVHVSPGVHLAGNVKTGKRTWVGIGASVIEGITIGSDVTIGAGSVVINDIPEGQRVAGVPARRINTNE